VQGPQGVAGPPGPQGQPGPAGPPGSGGPSSGHPGGRLTLVQGQPEMSADVTSPTIWYAPYGGDTFPKFDGASWGLATFLSGPTDQIGPSLSCGSKWAIGSYDIFGLASGQIASGPKWTAPDLANRGLTRFAGRLVNTAPVTLDVSNSASVVVPAYQAFYLGSINVSVAGQLTAHFSLGQNRKFEIWNAFNKAPIVHRVVDTSIAAGYYNPTNQYPAWQPFNNNPLNRGNPFTGLQSLVDVQYHQSCFVNSAVSGPSGILSLVGWNGVAVGYYGKSSSDTNSMSSGFSTTAHYSDSCAVGLNTATMFVAKGNASTSSLFSGAPNPPWPYPDINQLMLVSYQG